MKICYFLYAKTKNMAEVWLTCSLSGFTQKTNLQPWEPQSKSKYDFYPFNIMHKLQCVSRICKKKKSLTNNGWINVSILYILIIDICIFFMHNLKIRPKYDLDMLVSPKRLSNCNLKSMRATIKVKQDFVLPVYDYTTFSPCGQNSQKNIFYIQRIYKLETLKCIISCMFLSLQFVIFVMQTL